MTTTAWLAVSGQSVLTKDETGIDIKQAHAHAQKHIPTAGNLIALQLNSQSSNTEIHIMGKRCVADTPANSWCMAFTGTIVVYHVSTDTVTDAAMDAQIRPALEAVANIKELPTVYHSAWIYPANTAFSPRRVNIPLNGQLTQECARILAIPHSTIKMTQYVGPKNQSILSMGCVRGTPKEKNPWAWKMYGPILVMGGTIDEKTKNAVLLDITEKEVQEAMDRKLKLMMHTQ